METIKYNSSWNRLYNRKLADCLGYNILVEVKSADFRHISAMLNKYKGQPKEARSMPKKGQACTYSFITSQEIDRKGNTVSPEKSLLIERTIKGDFLIKYTH